MLRLARDRTHLVGKRQPRLCRTYQRFGAVSFKAKSAVRRQRPATWADVAVLVEHRTRKISRSAGARYDRAPSGADEDVAIHGILPTSGRSLPRQARALSYRAKNLNPRGVRYTVARSSELRLRRQPPRQPRMKRYNRFKIPRVAARHERHMALPALIRRPLCLRFVKLGRFFRTFRAIFVETRT